MTPSPQTLLRRCRFPTEAAHSFDQDDEDPTKVHCNYQYITEKSGRLTVLDQGYHEFTTDLLSVPPSLSYPHFSSSTYSYPFLILSMAAGTSGPDGIASSDGYGVRRLAARPTPCILVAFAVLFRTTYNLTSSFETNAFLCFENLKFLPFEFSILMKWSEFHRFSRTCSKILE